MSVYLDHIYIKSSQAAYEEAFKYFQKTVPAEIFIYGESEDESMPWGGFYVYFGGRFFIEFLDPRKCKDSKKIGLSFSCQKEFRGQFLNLIRESNIENKVENVSLPEEEPMMEICRLHQGDFLSTWGCEYSQAWEKDWGAQIAKYSMLSPFGDMKAIEIHSDKKNQQDIATHFNWIDPKIALPTLINLPLENGASQFCFNYIENGQELLVFEFENKEGVNEDFESDSFSIKYTAKTAQMIIVI